MPKTVKKTLASLLLATIIISILPMSKVFGDVSSCTANVSPNQVDPGSTNNFSMTVINTSGQTINWVRIARPNSNFTLGGIIATGWTAASTADHFTLTGRTINPGASRTFTLTSVVAANLDQSSLDWTVLVADDGAGTTTAPCSGTLGTQIGNPDTTAPNISNISIANLTTTSVTINWSTNEPSDSRVNYGLTASYGSSVSSTSLTTNHSLNLSNLSPNTGYHYQVVSQDGSGNSSSSVDNTFLTEAVPTASAGPTAQTTTKQPPTPSGQSSQSGDTKAPEVIVNTVLEKPFPTAPKIVGVAKDEVQVTVIDYSLDGGLNWLPVEISPQKEINFEFQPLNLEDGNYNVIVRAFDQANNIGQSESKVLIIDNIAPIIGGNIISAGPQLINYQDETIYSQKGIDQKITISIIGGPSEVLIEAKPLHNQSNKQLFTLARSPSTGLWSGIISFAEVGTYDLLAIATDGANNRTERNLNQAKITKAPAVYDSESHRPLASAKVTVMVRDKESSTWEPWQASNFGQINPATVNSRGEFSFLIPPGEYYLSAQADGYQVENSDIFALEQTSVLTSDILLRKSFSLNIGGFKLGLPDNPLNHFVVEVGSLNSSDDSSSLTQTQLPRFSLPNTSGGQTASEDLLGKPTLVCFMSTWTPTTEEQLSQLKDLNSNSSYNLVTVFSLESLPKVSSYKKIGSYTGEFLVDSLGELTTSLEIKSLPTTAFVNRSGVIKKVKTGVLSKEEITGILAGL